MAGPRSPRAARLVAILFVLLLAADALIFLLAARPHPGSGDAAGNGMAKALLMALIAASSGGAGFLALLFFLIRNPWVRIVLTLLLALLTIAFFQQLP